MNYLRDKASRRRNERKYFTIFLVISGLLAIFFYGPVVAKIFPFKTAMPIVKAEDSSRSWLGGFFDYLLTKKKLTNDIDQLRDENEQLQNDLALLEIMRQENLELKELLNLRGEERANRLAKVIARPGQLPYDLLIIELADNDEIRVGSIVMAEKDVVLGKIVSVSGRYAKVKMFSSNGEELPVNVGEANVPAVTSGRGAANYEIVFPRTAEIKQGDLVKTAVIGPYTIGLVGKIYEDPSEPFKKAILKIPVNIFTLKWVEVEK